MYNTNKKNIKNNIENQIFNNTLIIMHINKNCD